MSTTDVGATAYQISASPSLPLEYTAGCHAKPRFDRGEALAAGGWTIGADQSDHEGVGSVVENGFDEIDSDERSFGHRGGHRRSP